MATYCFYCKNCMRGFFADTRDPEMPTCCDEPVMVRDYRAENVGIGSGVRESRNELTTSGYRDLFLPTAEDMATADDPSGQKGLREWAETHGPKSDNKRPVYPVMDKKVFAVS